jgi:F-type H+-transporting ATPase subunit c
MTQFNYIVAVEIANLAYCSKLIGAAIATVGMVGAGIGIGVVFGCFLLAVSRNPGMEETLFFYALLGFALTEAIALFALMMSFIILFAL